MTDKPERDLAPAVTRSLSLLTLLEESAGAPLTLSDIARALGIAKSSTANLVNVLEEGRMIQRVPQGYILGRRTAELGGAFALQFNQIREFYGVCEVSDVLRREVVQVVMLDEDRTLYLARHEGTARSRLGTPLGSRLPAALTASGNALLAKMDDDDVLELLGPESTWTRADGRTTLDMDELLGRLATVRRRGYAVDSSEAYSGVTGIAVALEPWAPGDPPLSLAAALPIDRATPDRIQEVAGALAEAVVELTNPLARKPLALSPNLPLPIHP